MKWILHLSILSIYVSSTIAIAQDSGFHSPSDMNYKEPFFSLGADKGRSASVSVGDVNGDGMPDVVVANGRHWPQINQIFLGQSGRFQVSMPVDNIAMTSYTAELVDLDDDGDLDIVEINDMAPHRLFVNDGGGHFIYMQELASLSHARNVALADINGNGFSDILIINRQQRNTLCYNNGNWQFSCSPFGDKRNSAIDAAIADINDDGRPDILLANRDGRPSKMYLNQGSMVFSSGQIFGKDGVDSRSIAVADMDGDGFLDIVCANLNAPNSIYFGSKDLTFNRMMSFGDNYVDSYALTLADFDGDGALDIAVANYEKPNQVFFNEALQFRATNLTDMAARTYDIEAADLDNDGRPDIVVANSDDLNIYYLNRIPVPE